MKMSKLIGKNVVKKYGKETVLKNINIELESGKIYGLIGRNGAGKTTLMSILSGQNPQTEGEIAVDGMQVWENSEALSYICFSRELDKLAGKNGAAIKLKEYFKIASNFLPHWNQEMAEELIKVFGIDIKKKIGKLSKGMLSMVTIVVAMASKAEFTILDEPAAGLDVIAREKFYKILLEEFYNTGRTFVISTHIIEEAADIFEEVIFINKGQIILKENTQDLLERSIHVSGHEEEVDQACEGFEAHHQEKFGRSKGVDIFLKPGQKFEASPNITVQKMNLQKVFISLCGEEE